MATRLISKKQDSQTKLLYAALADAFPDLSREPAAVVYRYNPVSIRVRVITDSFQDKSFAERDRMIKRALRAIPEEVFNDISLIIAMTPEESEEPDLMNIEFESPNRSRL